MNLVSDGFVFSGVLISFVAEMKVRLSTAKLLLSCMLQYFQEFCEVDYGIKLSSRKLYTLCELEPSNCKRVSQMVTGNPGHPDQFSYIGHWLSLLLEPPPWLKCCVLK